MKDLTVGKRIIAGFAAIIIISGALGLFAMRQLRVISTLSTVTTTESLAGMDCVGRIETKAQANNLALIQSLTANNGDLHAELAAEILTNLQVIAVLTEEYRHITSASKVPQAVQKFAEASADYRKNVNDVLTLINTGKAYEAMRLKESNVDVFLATIQSEAHTDMIRGDTAADDVRSTASTTQISILSGVGLMLIVAIGVYFVIIRTINRVLNAVAGRLNHVSVQIVAAASHIASASETLAEGSGEQAASIQETSASLEEMASMTKRNAENAQKANELAKEARSAADKGAADMQTMNSAMEAIKVSSDDIAKIIKTIDEIAFQTNILALNAAVEAARAGEAGMGFAVVADEVRNLAQRSAQAAKETAAKIEGAIGKTAQGVQISQKVSDTLNNIVVKARQVDELASEVAGASREQTQGLTQITTAVGEMDKVTQSNAANAEESTATAQELNAQAEMMKQAVDELVQLVGAAAGSGSHADQSFDRAIAVQVPPSVRTIVPAIKKVKSSNGNGSHANGHQPAGKKEVATRRGEIPLEGDFKDF